MPDRYVYAVLDRDGTIEAVYTTAQTATQHADLDHLEVQRFAVLTKLRPY